MTLFTHATPQSDLLRVQPDKRYSVYTLPSNARQLKNAFDNECTTDCVLVERVSGKYLGCVGTSPLIQIRRTPTPSCRESTTLVHASGEVPLERLKDGMIFRPNRTYRYVSSRFHVRTSYYNLHLFRKKLSPKREDFSSMENSFHPLICTHTERWWAQYMRECKHACTISEPLVCIRILVKCDQMSHGKYSSQSNFHAIQDRSIHTKG